MSEATKGPWVVEHDFDIIQPHNGTQGRTDICHCYPWDESPEDLAEARANAQLISACPELVEALKAIIEMGIDDDPAVWAMANKALAKAGVK